MRRQQGFTLVEMMLAVGIAGILGYAAYVMLSQTDEAGRLAEGRADAERQTLLLLQRAARFVGTKKPGGLFNIVGANVATTMADNQCNRCNAPQLPAYGYSLHQDREGCKGPGLRNCRAVSVIRGAMWPNDGCGCTGEQNADMISLITDCARIKAAGSSALEQLNFSVAQDGNTQAPAECTSCAKGFRPIVMERVLEFKNSATPNAASVNRWRIFPDKDALTTTTGSTALSAMASKSQATMANKFRTNNAIGIELCTHLETNVILIDVNAFYLQKRNGSGYVIRKYKRQTSFPLDGIQNPNVRHLPFP